MQCNAVQLLAKNSLLYQIDEAHNIQAQGRKSEIVFFSSVEQLTEERQM